MKRAIPKYLMECFVEDAESKGRDEAIDLLRQAVIDRYGYHYWKGKEAKIREEIDQALFAEVARSFKTKKETGL